MHCIVLTFCCVTHFFSQADGTYKLHRGGWTLCDLGSHVCRWDPSTRKDVHTFYPLLYMFCRTECFDAYLAFFATLRSIPTLFGVAHPLDVAVGGLDRSTFIAEAFVQTWPEITLLLCWPHLARKFASNEFWAKLKVKDNKQLFEKHIRALHACRSAEQFRLLSEFVLEVWAALDERLFADYFEEYYVRDHWGNWFVTASPLAGVLPNAQGIESGHKIQKLVIGRCARGASHCACTRSCACIALRHPPRMRPSREPCAARARAPAPFLNCACARSLGPTRMTRRDNLRATTEFFLTVNVPKILAQAGTLKLLSPGYRSDGPLVADTLYEARELLALDVPFVTSEEIGAGASPPRGPARARSPPCTRGPTCTPSQTRGGPLTAPCPVLRAPTFTRQAPATSPTSTS